MIGLLSAPSLKLEGAAWALVLCYCDPFDRTRSFRDLLAEVCNILKEERLLRLSLPTETEGEDFVEGTLSWGDVAYDSYFEYSLGYLQLSGASEQAMRKLAAALEARTLPSAHASRKL